MEQRLSVSTFGEMHAANCGFVKYVAIIMLLKIIATPSHTFSLTSRVAESASPENLQHFLFSDDSQHENISWHLKQNQAGLPRGNSSDENESDSRGKTNGHKTAVDIPAPLDAGSSNKSSVMRSADNWQEMSATSPNQSPPEKQQREITDVEQDKTKLRSTHSNTFKNSESSFGGIRHRTSDRKPAIATYKTDLHRKELDTSQTFLTLEQRIASWLIQQKKADSSELKEPTSSFQKGKSDDSKHSHEAASLDDVVNDKMFKENAKGKNIDTTTSFGTSTYEEHKTKVSVSDAGHSLLLPPVKYSGQKESVTEERDTNSAPMVNTNVQVQRNGKRDKVEQDHILPLDKEVASSKNKDHTSSKDKDHTSSKDKDHTSSKDKDHTSSKDKDHTNSTDKEKVYEYYHEFEQAKLPGNLRPRSDDYDKVYSGDDIFYNEDREKSKDNGITKGGMKLPRQRGIIHEADSFHTLENVIEQSYTGQKTGFTKRKSQTSAANSKEAEREVSVSAFKARVARKEDDSGFGTKPNEMSQNLSSTFERTSANDTSLFSIDHHKQQTQTKVKQGQTEHKNIPGKYHIAIKPHSKTGSEDVSKIMSEGDKHLGANVIKRQDVDARLSKNVSGQNNSTNGASKKGEGDLPKDDARMDKAVTVKPDMQEPLLIDNSVQEIATLHAHEVTSQYTGKLSTPPARETPSAASNVPSSTQSDRSTIYSAQSSTNSAPSLAQHSPNTRDVPTFTNKMSTLAHIVSDSMSTHAVPTPVHNASVSSTHAVPTPVHNAPVSSTYSVHGLSTHNAQTSSKLGVLSSPQHVLSASPSRDVSSSPTPEMSAPPLHHVEEAGNIRTSARNSVRSFLQESNLTENLDQLPVNVAPSTGENKTMNTTDVGDGIARPEAYLTSWATASGRNDSESKVSSKSGPGGLPSSKLNDDKAFWDQRANLDGNNSASKRNSSAVSNKTSQTDRSGNTLGLEQKVPRTSNGNGTDLPMHTGKGNNENNANSLDADSKHMRRGNFISNVTSFRNISEIGIDNSTSVTKDLNSKLLASTESASATRQTKTEQHNYEKLLEPNSTVNGSHTISTVNGSHTNSIVNGSHTISTVNNLHTTSTVNDLHTNSTVNGSHTNSTVNGSHTISVVNGSHTNGNDDINVRSKRTFQNSTTNTELSPGNRTKEIQKDRAVEQSERHNKRSDSQKANLTNTVKDSSLSSPSIRPTVNNNNSNQEGTKPTVNKTPTLYRSNLVSGNLDSSPNHPNKFFRNNISTTTQPLYAQKMLQNNVSTATPPLNVERKIQNFPNVLPNITESRSVSEGANVPVPCRDVTCHNTPKVRPPTNKSEATYRQLNSNREPVKPIKVQNVSNKGTVLPNKEPNLSNKGPVLPNKEPNLSNKWPVLPNKEPNLSNKGPVLANKEPNVSNKGPVLSNKEPDVSNKGPVLPNKEPSAFKKGPVVSTKEPNVFNKEQLASSDQTVFNKQPVLVNKELTEVIQKDVHVINKGPTALFNKQPNLRETEAAVVTNKGFTITKNMSAAVTNKDAVTDVNTGLKTTNKEPAGKLNRMMTKESFTVANKETNVVNKEPATMTNSESIVTKNKSTNKESTVGVKESIIFNKKQIIVTEMESNGTNDNLTFSQVVSQNHIQENLGSNNSTSLDFSSPRNGPLQESHLMAPNKHTYGHGHTHGHGYRAPSTDTANLKHDPNRDRPTTSRLVPETVPLANKSSSSHITHTDNKINLNEKKNTNIIFGEDAILDTRNFTNYEHSKNKINVTTNRPDVNRARKLLSVSEAEVHENITKSSSILSGKKTLEIGTVSRNITHVITSSSNKTKLAALNKINHSSEITSRNDTKASGSLHRSHEPPKEQRAKSDIILTRVSAIQNGSAESNNASRELSRADVFNDFVQNSAGYMSTNMPNSTLAENTVQKNVKTGSQAQTSIIVNGTMLLTGHGKRDENVTLAQASFHNDLQPEVMASEKELSQRVVEEALDRELSIETAENLKESVDGTDDNNDKEEEDSQSRASNSNDKASDDNEDDVGSHENRSGKISSSDFDEMQKENKNALVNNDQRQTVSDRQLENDKLNKNNGNDKESNNAGDGSQTEAINDDSKRKEFTDDAQQKQFEYGTKRKDNDNSKNRVLADDETHKNSTGDKHHREDNLKVVKKGGDDSLVNTEHKNKILYTSDVLRYQITNLLKPASEPGNSSDIMTGGHQAASGQDGALHKVRNSTHKHMPENFPGPQTSLNRTGDEFQEFQIPDINGTSSSSGGEQAHSSQTDAGSNTNTSSDGGFNQISDTSPSIHSSLGSTDVNPKIPVISPYRIQDFSLLKPPTDKAAHKKDSTQTDSHAPGLSSNSSRNSTNEDAQRASMPIYDCGDLCGQGAGHLQPKAQAAVSAVLTTHFGPTRDQMVPFDLELLDLADNYDNTTGMFICTIPGTYVISLYLMSHPGAKVNARIFINNRPIAALWADDSKNAGFYPSSSTQTIAQLAFGDQVYVMLVDGGYGDSWVHANYNVFTVYLLYEQVF